MIPQESTPFHETPRPDDERAHRRDMVLLVASRRGRRVGRSGRIWPR